MSKRGVFVFLVISIFLISGCQSYFGEKTKGIQAGNSGLQKFDVNGDGFINNDDYFDFALYFGTGKYGPVNANGLLYDAKYDFNADEKIDNEDFFLLSDPNVFGQKVPVLEIPSQDQRPSLVQQIQSIEIVPSEITSGGGGVPSEENAEVIRNENAILIVTQDDQGNLSYNPGEKKVLDTTIKPSSNGKGKYSIYILTTPDFPEFTLSLYGKKTTNYKTIIPIFESSNNNFFGEEIKDRLQGKLYTSEFDYKELPIDGYYVGFNLFNADWEKDFPRGFSYPFLHFSIIDKSPYDVDGSCTILQKYGEVRDSIDIVYVPDGYDNSLEGKYAFAYDVDKGLQALWREPTLSQYKDKMNIYRVNELSSNLQCKPCEALIYGLAHSFCCNKQEVMDLASLCNSDANIINVLTTLQGETLAAGSARFIEKQIDYPLMQLKYNPAGIDSSGIAVSMKNYPTVPMHEMGHVVAALPDYYIEYDSKNVTCENHPCMMCSAYDYNFSDKGLCYDKQAMVEYLNQWCKVKEVKISEKNPRSPYPNPFNPNKNEKSNLNVNVKYEEGSQPCFALMKVYDLKGNWIDFLVSENPVEEGSFAFAWDGKDVKGKFMPSGTYVYEVSVGGKKRQVKATLLK